MSSSPTPKAQPASQPTSPPGVGAGTPAKNPAGPGTGLLGNPATRGPSVKDLLKMQWDYVVYTSETQPSDGTSVKAQREALPLQDAFRTIAGTDPRPLLVLRECPVCNKTDTALLRPGSDNERTIVLSRWFHCVKLPVDVIQPDQPFNALFPTNDAEHLFVCSVDGSSRIPLESDTSRPELWSAMNKVLAASYAKDPAAVAKEILHAHDKLDTLDAHIRDLEKNRDDQVESAGRLDKDKVKKLEKEIEAAKKELADEKKAIERLSKIELKPAKKAERT
jgi:hypothetical protein